MPALLNYGSCAVTIIPIEACMLVYFAPCRVCNVAFDVLPCRTARSMDLHYSCLERFNHLVNCTTYPDPKNNLSLPRVPSGTGHGGPGAAAFVNENLLNTLLSHEKFDTDLKTALSELSHLRTRLTTTPRLTLFAMLIRRP